jgi:hypothetical protein
MFAELIMQLQDKKSQFIFRLPKSTYKKERSQMTTNDEWIEINLNSQRTKHIKNEELKEKAKQLGQFNLKIVNILLETGTIESLLTNIPQEFATSQELKELYGERWGIETEYDVLKNKLHIENFSGKRRITIEQDFYSQILMHNMLIEIKHQCNQKIIKIKKYKNCEYEYKIKMVLLAGKLKINLFKIIFAKTNKERIKLEQEIQDLAMKNLRKIESKPSKTRKQAMKKQCPYNNRKNF